MLTVETQERRQYSRYCVFTVTFEHISHLFLVIQIVTFEQENVSLVSSIFDCLLEHVFINMDFITIECQKYF